MQPELKVELGLVQRRLPWLVAAAALLIYLVTLNHYSTFAGMAALAKTAGWDWRSNVVAPLHVVLTYPIRWLPAGTQLILLNLIAAVSAAAALGLLARSVALLPHDRTREQRAIERSEHSTLSIRAAWLPPVLAAAVCGLQLTFWENAVVATGEAFDLLLFAWLVHTLLMYRLDQKESRLSRFALVYGLAMTNNYAMIACLPAFAMALIWIRGMSFFKVRFLLRMTIWGLAGLSLYLLLPLIDSATDLSGFGFWELLKSYWGYQKSAVLGTPRYVIVFCSLTSLAPVLFMGIRWPAQFGESSAAGNALTNLMTHLIHGIFLLACLYVAFDPPFSPRGLTAEVYAMLPLYYLGALAIGYCSGYLLLVFGAKPGPQAWQRPSPLRRAANAVIVALVWVALVAVPAGLAVQNLPVVWANTGQAMSRLSQQVIASLPAGPAYILSDEPFRLHSLHYELLKAHAAKKCVLIDTSQLVASGYHRYMKKQYPEQWPEFQRPADPKALVDSISLIQLLGRFLERGQVFYLHPSFGYYFEVYYAEPHRAVYELKPHQDPNSVSPPVLTPEAIRDQDRYWDSLRAAEFDPLIKHAPPFKKPSKAKIKPKTLETYLEEAYSHALNDFGVRVQRCGNFVLAAKYFDLAVKLNPANPAAYLNREYNRAWQDKTQKDYKLSDGAKERLQAYAGRWDRILALNGMVEEPSACTFLGGTFQLGQNFRQSAQNLERVIFFDPDDHAAYLNYMMMCVKALVPDLALKKLAEFRARADNTALKQEEQLDLINIEAWAHVVKQDLPAAEALLAAAQKKYPNQSAPWDALSDIYLSTGNVTNALDVLKRQLQAQPNNSRALVNYGVIMINLDQPTNALPYLEQALRLNSKDELALLNRGIANLRLERLDAAEADFLALLSIAGSRHEIFALYQLADTYFQKKNKKACLQYYKEFLNKAPAGAIETQRAKERIRALESGTAF